MTIHITPEPDFSYVSFESNVPQASYKDVMSRVLETFQPGKFVLTVFANKVGRYICSLKEVLQLYIKYYVLKFQISFNHSLGTRYSVYVSKFNLSLS
jgi:S-adenosylmethionine decarboxylase